jgi:hypothetical protein
MYDPGTLYIDPILTNFSVGFADQALVGRDIFPETPVRTKSGQYRVYDRSAWLIWDSRREPGTVANEIVGAKWSQDVFSTREHSLQAPVFDEERQQLVSQGGLASPTFGGDLQIDPEVDATNLVTNSILLAHEKTVADTVRNTANYPGGNTQTNNAAQAWDNYAFATPGDVYGMGSNPLQDIRTAMIKIWTLTGRMPNTMVVPPMGVPYLENHPRIIDRFKNFTLSQPDAFKILTGFEGTVLLPTSKYNSANNIDATESIVDLWGKDVWIGIVDKQPGQRTKTFGKTFAQIYPDGSVRPTDRWREEPRKADIVRTSYAYDLKIVSSVAGYLIKQAFAATAW